jgi:hypothetical protein
MKTLKVVQSANRTDTEEAELFVLPEEINQITESEFEDGYETFARGEMDAGTRFPFYRVLWQWFATPHPVNDIRLLHLVLLYRRMESRIEEREIDEIECCTTDRKFVALTEDIGAAKDIPVRGNQTSNRHTRATQMILALIGVLPFLLDQLFSLIISPLCPRSEVHSTIVVPSIGGFHSIKDVLATAEFDFTVIIPPMTVAWIRSKGRFPDIATYAPDTFNLYSSLDTVRDEVNFLGSELVPALIRGRFDTELEAYLDAEFDVQMSNCIKEELNEIISTKLLRSLLYYPLADAILSDSECETLVVNSASLLGRSILAAGAKHEVELYHIRHSVVTGYTPETPFGSTEFVEGSLAIDYFEAVPYVEDTSDFVETGSPYLSKMYEESSGSYTPEEPLEILLTTSPYADTVRSIFLEEIIESLAERKGESTITIKPHPDEQAEFYEKLVANEEGVRVVRGNLQQHLSASDLVVTINSNTGLEAVLAGTPCVTLNFWKPFIRDMPYSRHFPVPALETSANVRQFFASLDVEELLDLQKRQQEAMTSSLLLDSDAAARIAEHIDGS